MPGKLNDNLVFNIYVIVSFCIPSQTGGSVILLLNAKASLMRKKPRYREGKMIK